MTRATPRWGAVTRSGYRNYHPLGQRLKAVLARPAMLRHLPDYGWLDGGCLQLADALVIWSGGRLQVGGVLRSLPTGLPFLDHAFAYYAAPGWAPIVWDGDGLQDEALLLEKLRRLEGAPWGAVQYQDCSRHAYGIPRHRPSSRAIAGALQSALGPFQVQQLSWNPATVDAG